MQGMRVWALVREDPTCRGATNPVLYNYRAWALEPVSHNYGAHTLEPVLRNKRSHCNEKPTHRNKKVPTRRNKKVPTRSNEDPTQPKKKKKKSRGTHMSQAIS